MPEPRKTSRSLATRFSIFAGLVLLWVLAISLWWDSRNGDLSWTKTAVMLGVVLGVAAAISFFTIRVLARPLRHLEAGIKNVGEGRLEPIQVSPTGDEIESLGRSFNRMIGALAASKEQIRQYQELLEERIKERTAELEHAMQAALAASQAKSEFLANMSHELRTPMNGLLGMMDVVLDSELTRDQRENLEVSRRCAYTLLDLLNDILDLSKIEAGRMALEQVPCHVKQVVQDCVRAQSAKAVQKGIDLRFDCESGGNLVVVGDPLRLRQVVSNLLSNALKFTESGHVKVRQSIAAMEGEQVMVTLEVADTGTGIDPEKLSSIFDKFTQADSSISRKYGGTGLGLTITQKLVEMHGGKIRVDSVPGKGSTFTVEIPFPVARQALPLPGSGRARAASAPPAALPQARLLLVEDNPVNQRVVLAMLRKKGFALEVAGNGRDALELLETVREPFDAVLMDIQMPVMDGLEATRAIRMDPRWANLPIIAMTAHAMVGDRERCLQAGMDDYITKPIQIDTLVTAIQRHVGAGRPEPPSAPPRRAGRILPLQDHDLLENMVRLFLKLAPERLRKIEGALARGDAATAAVEAHMIAAAGQQMGAISLFERAQTMAQDASRGDFEAVQRGLDTLREEIRSLEPAAPTV